jgi:hypothetical protein
MLSKGTIKVYSSLAVFLNSGEADSVLFKILDGFDVFAIWKIIVFAIGFSVFYQMTRTKAYTAITSLYIVYLIISISLSQLFKGFIS